MEDVLIAPKRVKLVAMGRDFLQHQRYRQACMQSEAADPVCEHKSEFQLSVGKLISKKSYIGNFFRGKLLLLLLLLLLTSSSHNFMLHEL